MMDDKVLVGMVIFPVVVFFWIIAWVYLVTRSRRAIRLSFKGLGISFSVQPVNTEVQNADS